MNLNKAKLDLIINVTSILSDNLDTVFIKKGLLRGAFGTLIKHIIKENYYHKRMLFLTLL